MAGIISIPIRKNESVERYSISPASIKKDKNSNDTIVITPIIPVLRALFVVNPLRFKFITASASPEIEQRK